MYNKIKLRKTINAEYTFKSREYLLKNDILSFFVKYYFTKTCAIYKQKENMKCCNFLLNKVLQKRYHFLK